MGRTLTSANFGSQLNSAKCRGELRKLVEEYFEKVRPTLASLDEQSPLVLPVDSAMQQLLVETHKRGRTARYRALLNEAREGLIQVHAERLIPRVGPIPMDPIDGQISAALQETLPSAALSYRQAVEDLKGAARLSWRGPATDLRESMRELLDHLAPDAEVEAAHGFKREPETRGPTMKQKVRFILRQRSAQGAAMASVETATQAVEEALGQFVRSVYTRSSVSTHVATSREEVLRIKALVQVVLQELLGLHA